MSCLPCGKVKGRDISAVEYYRKLYKDDGLEYYAYRLKAGESFSFVKKSYFNGIFETQIKPNFDNGAEYFHISEFTGD